MIQTQNLRKIYGMGDIQVKALDGVDIHINEGEFVAVMGPSGSGKSTLMNILGCLDRPTEGKYFLAGEDVSIMNKVQLAAIRNRRIGFIFQSFNLLPRTSALRNVMLPLVYKRGNQRSQKEREEKAMAALESVGLADRAHHDPNELSGGQKQRVAIARALVNDPVLIMADEPTGNLDTKTGNEIMRLMHDLHNKGRTILMVTHEPDIAEQTERTIVLVDGLVDVDGRNGDN
ncbi:MAG: ABC transporter ATP-binding protein [Anaerolineales bacterium]|nr:ABC transporter ATP-binding protein [Anaerolineales bacterium]MCA9928491.1 ABC transporter ATP-binding protein [Anaerolineales bacterium]